MKDFFKKSCWLNIIFAVILLIVGILLAAMQEEGAKIVYYIIGGTIIALGLALIIYACVKGLSKTKWEFPIGCLAIILGITLICKNDIIAQIFPMLFGLILVTDGFARLKDSIVLANKKTKKMMNSFNCLFSVFIFRIISHLFRSKKSLFNDGMLCNSNFCNWYYHSFNI